MGMTIQESGDMVNLRIIGRVFNRLSFPQYDNFKRYDNGSWAPSIRFHENKFWVYFYPRQRCVHVKYTHPEGSWSPHLKVINIKGWEDPCPFRDENGHAYLGHSLVGTAPIIIHKLSAEGTKLLANGNTVYAGTVTEGTKILKRNEYYYNELNDGGTAAFNFIHYKFDGSK